MRLDHCRHSAADWTVDARGERSCTACVDEFLIRIRVELYTAAQSLTGEQRADFVQLLSEVHLVAERGGK